jgi:hypothetical protein
MLLTIICLVCLLLTGGYGLRLFGAALLAYVLTVIVGFIFLGLIAVALIDMVFGMV